MSTDLTDKLQHKQYPGNKLNSLHQEHPELV